MTPEEITIVKALCECSLPPFSSQKRFVQDMGFLAKNSPEKPITARQAIYLCILVWRYWRQLSASIVEAALDLGELRRADANGERERAYYEGAAEFAATVHKRAQLKRAKERDAHPDLFEEGKDNVGRA